jgi:hypothetical protein
LSCLICYESINQYKILYDEYKKLSNNNSKNDDEEENKTQKKRNKAQKKNKNKNKIVLSKTLKLNETSQFLIETLNLSSDMNKSSSEISNEKIYIPKCIMIISLYPFFAEYEKILFKIYRYSMKIQKEPNEILKKESESKEVFPRAMTMAFMPGKKKINPIYSNITIPIDKIIENLVIEFPAPPRGVFKVQYSLITSDKIEFQQSLMNRLPIIQVNLKEIFMTFDIKEIVDIYLCLDYLK